MSNEPQRQVIVQLFQECDGMQQRLLENSANTGGSWAWGAILLCLTGILRAPSVKGMIWARDWEAQCRQSSVQVLLSRYSRSEDVVTGFASGEPAGADVARMTGQQSNPVALRTSFAGRAPAPAPHVLHDRQRASSQ